MNSVSYVKREGLNKQGSLIITDTDGVGTVITDIIKQIGSKILEGKLVDVMKISRPARLTAPLTHLTCIGSDFRYSELMIKAANENDPIERMKLLFKLGGIHLNLVDCKAKAPLNPILGETWQATKKDGCQIYLEQTSHHPPTSNTYVIGPDKCFEIFGFSVTKATLTGMNSIKGWREGKSLIRFKDGTMMTYTTPEVRINNLMMGERNVHFAGTFVIKDHRNKIDSVSTFSYRDIGNIENVANKLTGFFRTVELANTDTFTTTITKTDKTTKETTIVSQGQGSAFGQIFFDDKRYWSYDDPYDEWEQPEETFIIPSDSLKREDYKALLIPNNYNVAQKLKDDLENTQRKDKALRGKDNNNK